MLQRPYGAAQLSKAPEPADGGIAGIGALGGGEVAVEVVGFVEGAVRLAPSGPEMRERYAGSEAPRHGGEIVGRAHAERARAEADAVRLGRHRVEQGRIVLLRRGDAGQAEQRT